MVAPSPTHVVTAPVHYTNAGSVSPRSTAPPKTVAFELLFSGASRARLPLRVSIFPHDTTESIVTTVKNFYGLYSGPTVSKGVSFEDKQGNTLIARYENFTHDMVVNVRVIEETAFAPQADPTTQMPPPPYYAVDGYVVQGAPQYEHHGSRPASRTSGGRSASPHSNRGRRSVSESNNAAAGKKGRSRSSKTRGPGSQFNGEALSESMNGYSSGDGEMGSVSGKVKEQIGNTEISVENIVEGGRRKRAKFESSELPLFAPPQMPAATSNASVSPARRVEHHRLSLPFVQPGQNPFTNIKPLQSPQNYNNNAFGYFAPYNTPASDSRSTRHSVGYVPGAATAPGMSMMPTPDPTVGSCMSEEDKDVAIQLMRLGEMSNISHGRTSASTMDDTFSGRADAASSTGATSDAESDSEEDMPTTRRQRLDESGNHKKMTPATGPRPAEASSGNAEYEEGPADGLMAAPKSKNIQSKMATPGVQKPRSNPSKTKTAKSTKSKAKKSASVTGPMSPASMPASSRKPSVGSNAAFFLTPGEDGQPDLSTKPRCQRCRKSKKGCDRQRPCGRCRDAGIPAELCISEDEGNGRKGRYGRHMGVPVVKDEAPVPPALLPSALISAPASAAGGAVGAAVTAPALAGPAGFGSPTTSAALVPNGLALDKNKKRKR